MDDDEILGPLGASESVGPWSPHAHEIFPRGARARACALLLIGAQLSRWHGDGGSALLDVWISGVMPLVVERRRYGVDNDDEGCPGEDALLYAQRHPRTDIPKDEELASAAARFHEMMQTTGMMTGMMYPNAGVHPMAGMMGSDFLSDSE